jgi:hypothetical protein
VPASAARLYDVLDRVLDEWDDAALDDVVAANIDGDVPRDLRRREAADAVAAVGGGLGARDEIVVRTPSSATWWRRGAHGRVRVEVLLTPQAQQRVQTFDVRGVPDPAPEVRACAERITASLWAGAGWPSDVARAEGVDADHLSVDAARATAAGVRPVLDPWPVAAASARDTVFELRGPDMRAQLHIVLHEDSVVTSCSLTVLGDPWPTAIRSR